MKSPALSIIMLVHNSALFLREAVDSILAQTFKDFELLIIDDGSTDKSREILHNFDDNRIRIFFNEENNGIVFSRNKGLIIANGKYIAMFDSDDISTSTKFEKQINFLEKNPEYGMVGCCVETINSKSEKTKKSYKLKAKPGEIPSILLFRNYFINSAVVFRKEIIQDFVYPTGYDIVEDYYLWIFISKRSKVWNLSEYLIKYRIHDSSITKKRIEALKRAEIKLFSNLFNELEIPEAQHNYNSHFLIKNDEKLCNKNEIIEVEMCINLLYYQNKKVQLYNNRIFVKTLFNRWLKALNKSKHFGIFTALRFLRSRLLWIYLSQIVRLRQ